MSADRDFAPECCLPGDVIVTPVHGGFMAGVALPKRGLGPWWAFVRTTSSFVTAIREARLRADATGTRVWFQEGSKTYRLISADTEPSAVEE